MPRRVDAVIVADNNIPLPKSNNCMTREKFYESLVFDTTLINLPSEIKDLNDPDVLLWVINNVANNESRFKSSNSYNYCFFVTKDYNFKADSNFYRYEKYLRGNCILVVVIIPATEKIQKLNRKNKPSPERRTLNRAQLLNIIINKLNDAWRNRSPR